MARIREKSAYPPYHKRAADHTRNCQSALSEAARDLDDEGVTDIALPRLRFPFVGVGASNGGSAIFVFPFFDDLRLLRGVSLSKAGEFLDSVSRMSLLAARRSLFARARSDSSWRSSPSSSA